MRYSLLLLLVCCSCIAFAQKDSVLLNEGVALYSKAEYGAAIEKFQAGLKITTDKRNELQLHRNLGNAYSQTGRSVEALQEYQSSLKISEAINDKSSSARTLTNIGALYEEMKDLDQAMKQYRQAATIATEIKDSSAIADCANNIGIILEQKNDFAGAAKEYETALYIYQQKGIKDRVCLSYNNLGVMYKNMGKYPEAIGYYERSRKIAEELGDAFMMGANLVNIGNVYERLKDYNKAIDYNKQGLDKAASVDALNVVVEAAVNIAGDYAAMNDFAHAYEWQKKYDLYHDSLVNTERTEQLAGLQTKYETEKKERELADKNLLVQKREFQIGAVCAVFVLLCVAGGLLYRNQRLKQRQQREKAVLDAEYKERLRIARDVHDDLGSGLSRISLAADMATKKIGADQPYAADMHSIAGLSKELVDNMRDLIWVLNPEHTELEVLLSRIREFCSDYLEENNIDFQLKMPQDLPQQKLSREMQRNIWLTVKEAVHNTVKYANATAVSIQVQLAGEQLSMRVADNGKGFDVEQARTGGNGLKNMRQRIESMNGRFNIVSSVGKGSELAFEFPLSKVSQPA